ncbi:MAG: response regulator [Myxococcaceae bacterium]|nr:response regulator [Myxococcaceae bacterium]
MARLLIIEDQAELAALVSAAARARGHVVTELHDGAAALARIAAERFDAAIVDLLLPDVPGSDVLGALKARGIPSFAVSGVYKGERFAQEAVSLHGARAFFEKPFDLDALLAAVEKVTGPAAEPTSPEPDDLDELRIPAPFFERDKVWGEAPAPAPARPRAAPDWANAGTLSPGAIARLLNAYYQARHTGELKLRHGQVVKVVYFESGKPVYAASNVATERFARFCALRGVLPESELAAVASLAKESNLRTGEAMIQLGLITAEQRRHLLEEQIKAIIWSTFGWTEGEYAFSARRPQRVDLVKLSVFPGDLIMEGARREPLVNLRKKLPADRRLFPTTDPPYQLHEIHLGGPEAHLLVWADGSKTVEDLVALSDLGEREVLGTLYGFELLGLLEERRDLTKDRRISFGL